MHIQVIQVIVGISGTEYTNSLSVFTFIEIDSCSLESGFINVH